MKPMPVTSHALQKTSRHELDDLYMKSLPGDIPQGNSRGTALIFPGTFLARPLAVLIRLLFWQGKIFRPNPSRLVNKILPFRLHAINASVYKAPSWLDGRETIVLDYSKTSWLAWFVRDEIREVSPGLYLGIVYVGRDRFIHFAVEFKPMDQQSPVQSAQSFAGIGA
jgi:hypothetical protein